MALAHSGYDIIMPTNEPTLSRLVRGDRLAPIDRDKVPNGKNLDLALMRMVAPADPGNKYGAIYLWGTLGLGMLPDKVRALVPNVPLDSLDLLFKPENAQRLQPCGITILDSPPEVVPTVLHYLGLSHSSTSASDLAAVERTLMGIRPYIRTFSATSALETLVNGSTCLAMAFSGNVLQAVVRAKAANRGVNVAYYAPRGGTQASFDVLAIPNDAPNKDAANGLWCTNKPIPQRSLAGCVLHDPNRGWHTNRCHLIENVACDLRLGPLIGQTPSVQSPANDRLVAIHRGFSQAATAVA